MPDPIQITEALKLAVLQRAEAYVLQADWPAELHPPAEACCDLGLVEPREIAGAEKSPAPNGYQLTMAGKAWLAALRADFTVHRRPA